VKLLGSRVRGRVAHLLPRTRHLENPCGYCRKKYQQQDAGDGEGDSGASTPEQ